jgi:hypothetical protein
MVQARVPIFLDHGKRTTQEIADMTRRIARAVVLVGSLALGIVPVTAQQRDAQPSTTTPSLRSDANPNQSATGQDTDPAIRLSNIVIATCTAALVVVTGLQWWTYRQIHATTKAIERAWISVEGLSVEEAGKTDRAVTIHLKNSGRMAAHIVDANITIRGSKCVHTEHGESWESIDDLNDVPAGDRPVYDSGDFVAPAILVAGEVSSMRHVVHDVTDENFNLLTLKAGQERNLWIYGYVRYTDDLAPKTIRSYGWARRYDAAKSKSTPRYRIRFVHVSRRGYNYAD